jgi:hypothetical protein
MINNPTTGGMMKKWVAYLLAPLLSIAAAGGVIVAMSACATTQNILPPDQLKLQEVITLDSTRTKDELYVSCMEWMARTFRSAKDVIQYEDKAAGMIVGKGSVIATGKPYKTILFVYNAASSAYSSNIYLRFTITLEVKDAKVRVTLDQISSWVETSTSEAAVETLKMFEAAKPDLQSIIDDLKTSLSTPQQEDW